MVVLAKICGITHTEDALAAVEAGATALGFNFYPRSPRYIKPQAARAIVDQLPDGVLRVGVFVDETAEAMAQMMAEAGMEVAQVYRGPLPDPPLRSWRARNVDPTFDRRELDDPVPEAFLLDAPAPEGVHGGTGETFDWTRVREFAGGPKKIVLAGGLDAGNVGRAIATARPWGVDACSRLESRPGRKDLQKVREFLAAVAAAAQTV